MLEEIIPGTGGAAELKQHQRPDGTPLYTTYRRQIDGAGPFKQRIGALAGHRQRARRYHVYAYQGYLGLPRGMMLQRTG